jgi:hypothetical protein
MINPLYYLPGSRKQQLSVLVLAVGVPLVVWQATVYYERRSPYLNVMLGRTAVKGVAESGFHFQEYTDSVPFRWTNGDAKLLVPISPRRPPQRLWISIETFRAKPTTVRFQVLVDDSAVFDGSVPLGSWEETFDLSSHRFSKQAMIEIRSATFVPKGLMDGGKNTDTRVLGVQVKGIMLQRGDMEEAQGCNTRGA